MTLHHEAAESVVAYVDDWQPLAPLAEPPVGVIKAESLRVAEQAVYDLQWLAWSSERLDEERLRQRNLIEAAQPDLEARAAVARACEDLSERFEVLVPRALQRTPALGHNQVWIDHCYSSFNNIAGLRLLIGEQEGTFAERFYAAYRQGVLPVGWSGRWPNGRFIAWWEER